MSKYTRRTAMVQAAIKRSRLRREVAEALKTPTVPMSKEEAFRGFTDEDAAYSEYIRQKREERKDSGV